MNDAASLASKIAALEQLPRQELLAQWSGAFGETAPSGLSAPLMRRALAHQIQCAAHGGLSPKTKRALKQAATPNAAPPARHLSAGARLVREWNGVNHVVDVVEGGFRYRDRRYKSLSAIATVITGAKWSGPRFFGLKARSDK